MDMIGLLDRVEAGDAGSFGNELCIIANDIDRPTHEVLREVVASNTEIFGRGPKPRTRLETLVVFCCGVHKLCEQASGGKVRKRIGRRYNGH